MSMRRGRNEGRVKKRTWREKGKEGECEGRNEEFWDLERE